MVKRFKIETSTLNQKFPFISDNKKSKLVFAATGDKVKVQYKYRSGGETHDETLVFPEFMDVKGWKAMGNKLMESKIISIKRLDKPEQAPEDSKEETQQKSKDEGPLKPGDTIDLFG